MVGLFELLPEQWQSELTDLRGDIQKIDVELQRIAEVIPEREYIFRALPTLISECRVLIVGQDPYPQKVNATGLAFSVSAQTSNLPASLRNIFKELKNDLQGPLRTNGDLTDWADQGVVLLNRILTTQLGIRGAHLDIGWQSLTWKITSILANNGVPALLWGKVAAEMATLFASDQTLLSAHPSPLSAHRGFYGSKPFSWINSKLDLSGQKPIHWG